MAKAYTYFAYLIALEVVVQAGALAWGLFGFGKWIDEGNVFNKAVLECEDCGWNFASERGFMIHGLNGAMIIPLVALIFLIFAFFAKVPGGAKWAAIVFALVIIQSQVLPPLAREYSGFGALHGVNAILLLLAAIHAGRRVPAADRVPATVAA